MLLLDLGSGSWDPESDYDFTVSTKNESNLDVLAVQKFNTFF